MLLLGNRKMMTLGLNSYRKAFKLKYKQHTIKPSTKRWLTALLAIPGVSWRPRPTDCRRTGRRCRHMQVFFFFFPNNTHTHTLQAMPNSKPWKKGYATQNTETFTHTWTWAGGPKSWADGAKMFSRGGRGCWGLLGDCGGRGAELVTGASNTSNVLVSTETSQGKEKRRHFKTPTTDFLKLESLNPINCNSMEKISSCFHTSFQTDG